MNKINPLYMLLFFLFAAVIVIYKTTTLEQKIETQKRANTVAKSYARQIRTLKSQWKDSKKMLSRIGKIVSAPNYAKFITKKEKKRKSFFIEAKGMDKRTLDSFVNKLLNEAIAIKKLRIVREDAHKASLFAECAL